jgi:hypothetical protein
MFGWFKSERRERQKKVRQDRKHLEEPAKARAEQGATQADPINRMRSENEKPKGSRFESWAGRRVISCMMTVANAVSRSP